jgi:hypothetical protein
MHNTLETAKAIVMNALIYLCLVTVHVGVLN